MRIFDTLSQSERELEPEAGRRVRIYACGPTVYAPVHVGNARPFVVFSLLKRFLEHEGYDVTFVANITDVNDKIYDAAREAGVPSARARARRWRRATSPTPGKLGLGRPDVEPKATETIGPIIDLIQDLIDSGHAYASQGDVYFRVRSFADYGKLSNRPVAEMDQGEDDEGPKEDPIDFALWKAQKPGEDTAWDAPWGRGRPGWHIECSAMAEHAFGGVDFEIHGGGNDLIFPHHENEIAQTEAARGEPLAKIWMHNGMLQFMTPDTEGPRKMSKSEGNIRSLSGALDEDGRDALVMYFVQGHYRKPIDYSVAALERALQAVARMRELTRRLDPDGPPVAGRRRARDALLRRPRRRLQHARGAWRSSSSWWPRPTGGSRRARPWAPARCARCSGRSASTTCSTPTATRPTRTPSGCSASARKHAPRRTSRPPTPAATSYSHSAGRCATHQPAPSSSAPPDQSAKGEHQPVRRGAPSGGWRRQANGLPSDRPQAVESAKHGRQPAAASGRGRRGMTIAAGDRTRPPRQARIGHDG